MIGLNQGHTNDGHEDIFRMLGTLLAKTAAIEALLQRFNSHHASIGEAKKSYTTAEFAENVGRAEYTVRMWCLNERVRADKAAAGRGVHGEWRISHEELVRYMNHGLLPLPRRRKVGG